jgi:hypothetical protein
MASDKSDSFTKSVPSLTEDDKSQIPANNSIWNITQFIADCASGDMYVALVWDYEGAGEQILVSSHGPSSYHLDIDIVGDGVKKLSIVLNNPTTNTEVMMGIVKAKEKM